MISFMSFVSNFNVDLFYDVLFSSFQGRSSSPSSFYASLLQAVDGVTSLDFCTQVVSQAPQHFCLPRLTGSGHL